MPLREMRQKFTKSEIAIMGWRSAEMAVNMRNQTERPAVGLPVALDGSSYDRMENVDHDAVLKGIEERLGGIVYKLENDKGQIDLRRLTGDEALQYMTAIGMPVIPMNRL